MIFRIYLQVVLITLVYLIVPRANSSSQIVNPDEQDTFSVRAEQLSNKIPEGQGHDAYVVVFDAGSTGVFCPLEYWRLPHSLQATIVMGNS